jgi:hypothetical protein
MTLWRQEPHCFGLPRQTGSDRLIAEGRSAESLGIHTAESNRFLGQIDFALNE